MRSAKISLRNLTLDSGPRNKQRKIPIVDQCLSFFVSVRRESEYLCFHLNQIYRHGAELFARMGDLEIKEKLHHKAKDLVLATGARDQLLKL